MVVRDVITLGRESLMIRTANDSPVETLRDRGWVHLTCAALTLNPSSRAEEGLENPAPPSPHPPANGGLGGLGAASCPTEMLPLVVFHEPVGGTYQSTQILTSGVIYPLSFPTAAIAVDRLIRWLSRYFGVTVQKATN